MTWGLALLDGNNNQQNRLAVRVFPHTFSVWWRCIFIRQNDPVFRSPRKFLFDRNVCRIDKHCTLPRKINEFLSAHRVSVWTACVSTLIDGHGLSAVHGTAL